MRCRGDLCPLTGEIAIRTLCVYGSEATAHRGLCEYFGGWVSGGVLECLHGIEGESEEDTTTVEVTPAEGRPKLLHEVLEWAKKNS